MRNAILQSIGLFRASTTLAGFTQGGSFRPEEPVDPGPQPPAQLLAGEWDVAPIVDTNLLSLSISRSLIGITGMSILVDDNPEVSIPFTAIAAGPVALAAPVVTGVTVGSGGTLITDLGRWLSSTDITDADIRWLRDGLPISGAISASYVTTEADVGTILTSEVTVLDAVGSTISTSVGTEITAEPVAGVAPTISALTITGATTLGATLTANLTFTAGTPAATPVYQWRRAGAEIVGATSSTYVRAEADAGTNITVTTSLTNASGFVELTSDAVAIPANPPSVPDLFAVSVGALLNANAFDMGDAAWANDGSTTIAALTADGPYLAPKTITVSVAQSFRGRKTSIGSPTGGTLYRCAAMVKAGTGNRCQIQIESGSNSATVYTVDVSGAGTLTTTHSATRPGTITNAVIEDAGDGYRRIRFDYTPASTAAHTLKVNPFAGVVGASIDAYGCGMAAVA